MSVLALDFDGVLCDSVEETGTAGWKAGGAIWEDMRSEMPPPALLTEYRRARPVIETGFEAILVMRLLLDGEDPHRLLETFSDRLPGVVARTGRDIASLKALFGETRDRWLASAPDQWLAFSPLYPGVARWLIAAGQAQPHYIVTTKETRFVQRILAYNGVAVPEDRIFGLERGRPKDEVLHDLMERHGGRTIYFVEDRLATLKRCLARPDLNRVALRLAGWGYNTAAERGEARRLGIPLWDLDRLLAFQRGENDLDQ
jgi:phosphoglycolate phosphatase-like HAD superfamily hydrolase